MTTPERPEENPTELHRDYEGMDLLPPDAVAAMIERRRAAGIDGPGRLRSVHEWAQRTSWAWGTKVPTLELRCSGHAVNARVKHNRIAWAARPSYLNGWHIDVSGEQAKRRREQHRDANARPDDEIGGLATRNLRFEFRCPSYRLHRDRFVAEDEVRLAAALDLLLARRSYRVTLNDLRGAYAAVAVPGHFALAARRVATARD